MACGGCGQARAAFYHSVRTYNLPGAVRAIRTGVSINVDKMRGMSPVDIDRKYGGSGGAAPVVKAAPYRRTR